MRNGSRVAVVLGLLALVPAMARASDAYPRTAQEAMNYYEADPDQWLDGPVQYIIVDAERGVFKQLQTRTERARFIRRFWERRDLDLRDRVNPFETRFYELVADANARFHGYPRGWESDRGLIQIVLGRPDHVSAGPGRYGSINTWTYYTIGPQGNDRPLNTTFGSMEIYFIATGGRDRYEILGDFGGPGMYPLYVRDALDIVRLAAIDPSIGRRSVE